MKRVIIDSDPGIDDAMAILLALNSPELVIEAVTIVSGNVHVDVGAENALKVLEVASVSRISVAKGMTSPLMRRLETAEAFHGVDGLGGAELPKPKVRVHNLHAVDMIIRKVKAHPKEITLMLLGPLTNVATAFLMEPKIVDQVKEIVLMGGSYGLTQYSYGMWDSNALAEFNIYVDPEAARIVFHSGIPITGVGLDVTRNPAAGLKEEHLKILRSANTPASDLIVKMIEGKIRRMGSFSLHDPMAVAAAIDRSLVATKKYYVDVETMSTITRGQTIVDKRPHREGLSSKPNLDVCCEVDGNRFVDLFLERVTKK